MDKNMDHLYNWPRFYRALCQKGSTLLLGVDDDLREIIHMSASTTDQFWSEGLEDLLAASAAVGDLRAGVLSALALWRENVLETLETDFGFELDWELVYIDDACHLVDELVEAASPG
jgi:hypothetical protein